MSMLSRFKIIHILMFSLTILCLSQILSGGRYYSSIIDFDNTMSMIDKIHDAEIALYRTQGDLSSARVITYQKEKTGMSAEDASEVMALVTSSDNYYQQFKSLDFDDNDRINREKLYQNHDALRERIDRRFSLANDDKVGIDKVVSEINLYERLFAESIKQYNIYTQNRMDAMYAQIAKSSSNNKLVMLVLIMISVLLILIVGLYLRIALLRPLHDINVYISNIGNGLLNNEIKSVGKNEISGLMKNLSEMQTQLIYLVSKVHRGASQIFTRTGEIATGNNELSVRTEQQATALQQTAASMEEITVSVKQNAENAALASQLAEAAKETAECGGNMMIDIVETMRGITGSSEKIADITGVIDGIAFQTNILSLNAAVEAARAGEQGRGFAVVAGEVRNLAQRSANAAKEVKTLIDESIHRIKFGANKVEDTGKIMVDVVDSIKQVNDLMKEISLSSDEQSRGISQVTLAITEMDNVTQHNASMVGSLAITASSLEEEAEQLHQAVGVFVLNEDVQQQKQHAATVAFMLPEKKRMTLAKPVLVTNESPENWETF